jgi:hypothetical protein
MNRRLKKKKTNSVGLLLMTGNNRLKDVNNMSKDAIELDNQFAKSALKSVKSG